MSPGRIATPRSMTFLVAAPLLADMATPAPSHVMRRWGSRSGTKRSISDSLAQAPDCSAHSTSFDALRGVEGGDDGCGRPGAGEPVHRVVAVQVEFESKFANFENRKSLDKFKG
jgi:hypothetical protein